MADLLTAQEVNDYLGREDGDKLLEQYFSEAVDTFNRLTCGAFSPDLVIDAAGLVGDDGKTVRLPNWFRDINSVSDEIGASLEYKFTATVSDTLANGDMSQSYGKTLILEKQKTPGTVVTVNGYSGFEEVPPSIKHCLCALMKSSADRVSGEDAIKSKSIEDVNVSTDTKSGESPVQIALDTHQGVIDKWSLCQDKYNLGDLAYPDKLPSYPYFASPAELGGGSSVSIGRVL